MDPAATLRKFFFESIGGLLPVDRLFDGVPDIVFFVKDARGRYMAVNDTLAARCGLSNKDEAIGRTAEELFPPPLGDAFAQQDRDILRGGSGIRDHLELHLYPGGRRGWCLTFKEPIPGKNGGVAGICGISRDLHAPGADDGDFAAMSAATDHIQRHFDEALRLPALAEMAGLSVYQFDQRIRAAGVGIHSGGTGDQSDQRHDPAGCRGHQPADRFGQPDRRVGGSDGTGD